MSILGELFLKENSQAVCAIQNLKDFKAGLLTLEVIRNGLMGRFIL